MERILKSILKNTIEQSLVKHSSLYISTNLGVINASIGDAVMDIKLSATKAHLRLEEVLGGAKEESAMKCGNSLRRVLGIVTRC